MKRSRSTKSNTRVCKKRKYNNAPSTSGYVIRNMVRGFEVKTIDTTNATSVGNYGTYYATNDSISIITNLITLGAGYNQRVGNKIKIKSIRINAFVFPSDILNATKFMVTPVRFMVIYDRQCNGVTLSNAGFFEKPTHTLGFQDPAYNDRYTVIMDHTETLIWLSNYNSPTDNSTIFFKRYKKFKKPLDTLFGASTGNMSDIQTGALFFVVFTESTSAANIFNVTYNIRVKYYDN